MVPAVPFELSAQIEAKQATPVESPMRTLIRPRFLGRSSPRAEREFMSSKNPK